MRSGSHRDFLRFSGGGFGAKPATTGVFGSTQPQQQTGSLFGNSQTTGTQTGAPLFGQPQQQQQQQQPATGGSLFGSTQTQQPQGGGLFGSTQQPAQSTGGLFGSTTTQQQPGQGGSLFGSTTTQPSQGGGLFGAQQPVQQQGGIFGATQQQQPQQQGNSLFGNTQQPATGQTPSLFGATQQQQQPSGTSLFGSTQQPQTGPSLFGSATQPPLFGTTSAATQPQQQSTLGATFGAKPLTARPALTNQVTCRIWGILFAQSKSPPRFIVQSRALSPVARGFCQGAVSRQVLIIYVDSRNSLPSPPSSTTCRKMLKRSSRTSSERPHVECLLLYANSLSPAHIYRVGCISAKN